MPFFQVDDQMHVNTKTQKLIDMGQLGLAALGLWTLAGSQVQAKTGADGRVDTNAWRLLGDRRMFNRLAKILVDVRLWEDREDGEEGWQYHDWWDIGYERGAKVKLRRKRTSEMKNPEITAAVKARDGLNCRYCGRKVTWDRRRGDDAATYDHVIPGMARGVGNLVVCCFKCNRIKAQRTPEQAGMTLLPPPNGPDAPPQSQTQNHASRTSNRTQNHGSKTSNPGGPLGQGQGQGTGLGLGPGEVAGRSPDQVTAEGGPAGEAPPVPIAEGHTGSPWFNHHGPAPNVDEPRCEIHGLDLPCRKCTAATYAEEATVDR